MNEKTTVEIVVSYLCKVLEIKQNQLARMLKLNDTTISKNLHKCIDEVKTTKSGKRLLPLFLIVVKAEKKAINKEAIIEGLNEPVIPNILKEGNESVLEAILSESITNCAILIEKHEKGIKSYITKKEKANKKLNTVKNQVELLYA